MSDTLKVVAVWFSFLTVLSAQFSAVHAEDSSAVAIQRISLPRGPGSVEGLGESVVPDLVSGSARYSVPIEVPKAANEHVPKLILSYDSGSGIGSFGLGWSISAEAIQRQTDKGIPEYSDHDNFIFGNEELVRLTDDNYLAENRVDFSRFRKSGDGWRQSLQTGTTVDYGVSEQAREQRPRVQQRNTGGFPEIFKWHKSSSTDVHGNRIEYEYCEFPESVGTKLLRRIRYGFRNWPAANYHEVLFDYEASGFASTSFCSSFEHTICHRCCAISVSTVVGNVTRPVRKYILTYAKEHMPLLESITKTDGRGNGLPPLRFAYNSATLQSESEAVSLRVSLRRGLSINDIALCDLNRDGLPDLCISVPGRNWEYLLNRDGHEFEEPRLLEGISSAISLRDSTTQLMDITGDGVVDLLTASPSAGDERLVAYYEFSLKRDSNSQLGQPTVGTKKLFNNSCDSDLFGPGMRVFDVNFDKSVDVTRILDDSLIVALNRTTEDFSRNWSERRVFFSESHFPFETFSPSMQLTDLNGDRLMDCVDVFDRDGLVTITVYPGHGDGRFGIGRAFEFADDVGTSETGSHPTSNLQSFHFGDVNSDGLTDLIHVIPGNVRVWISWGQGFEKPQDFDAPTYRTSTQVMLADLNANGSTDVIWIDPSSHEQLQVLDCFPQGRGNLLKTISNGVGKLTTIRYRPLNDYYLAHNEVSRPWPVGCPLATHVVSNLSVSNSLDLNLDEDADTENTSFVYANPYYDGFERQFRGFAFVTEINWGVPLGSKSGTATRVRRLHFHTGANDGIDNDGNGKADEADLNYIAGREEEPLKGRLIWEETCELTAVNINPEETVASLQDSGINDGADNDGDGQIDESDEGVFCADKHVFRRQLNDWSVRRLFSNDYAPVMYPQKTADRLRLIRDAVLVNEHVLHVEGPNVWKLPEEERADWEPRHVKKTFAHDEFGRLIKTIEHGVISPHIHRDAPRYLTQEFAGGHEALEAWILDRLALSMTCGTDGKVVFAERHFYGDDYHSFEHLALRSIGTKALKIKSERLFLANSQEGIDQSALDTANWIQGTAQQYDEFGNIELLLDGLGNPKNPKSKHSRIIEYDHVFHTFPISETIHVSPQLSLRADASYDLSLGVLTSITDFEIGNSVKVQDSLAGLQVGPMRQVLGNVTFYRYDSHGRLSALIRPGDSEIFPTESYRYIAADPADRTQYQYASDGTVTVVPDVNVWKLDLGAGNGELVTQIGLSAVITEKREVPAKPGTVASVKLTDGFNRVLSIASESDNEAILFSERTLFDNRGNPQLISQPYIDLEWKVRTTGVGDRVLRDPLGRIISWRRPPDEKGIVAFTRSIFLPLAERIYDEEATRVGGKHEGTMKELQKDGFDRLATVCQSVKLEDDGSPSKTLKIWTTLYRYDLSDNLVLTRDAQNNTTYHDHDTLNRRCRLRDPDRGTVTFTYDAANNLLKTQDARGAIITCTYDGANRKVSENGSFGAFKDIIKYHFDEPATNVIDSSGQPFVSANCRGRLAWIEDPTGTEYLSYDSRGNSTHILKRIGTKSYMRVEDFDSQNRLSRQVIGGFGITLKYGRRGLLNSLHDLADNELVVLSHHPNGAVHTETAANSVVTERLLDHRLRCARLSVHGPGGEGYYALDYSYDAASNLVHLDDRRPMTELPIGDPRRCSTAMKYDNLYRLSEESHNIGLEADLITITTKYDRIGNVLRREAPVNLSGATDFDLGLGTRHYEARSNCDGSNAKAPGPHAMTTTSSGSSIQYALDGSMVSLNDKKLERDAWGRIRRVLLNGTVKTQSWYDYKGERVRVTDGNGDRYSPFIQLDDNPNGTIDYYCFERDRRLIGFHSTGNRYYHYNHLNSVILVTSEDGAVDEEIAYFSSGKVRNTWRKNGSGFSRYSYSGKELESASGLYLFDARRLDSGLGLFTSCDSELSSATADALVEPLALNPYIYSLHNPLRYVDPDGRTPYEAIRDTLCSPFLLANKCESAGISCQIGAELSGFVSNPFTILIMNSHLGAGLSCSFSSSFEFSCQARLTGMVGPGFFAGASISPSISAVGKGDPASWALHCEGNVGLGQVVGGSVSVPINPNGGSGFNLNPPLIGRANGLLPSAGVGLAAGCGVSRIWTTPSVQFSGIRNWINSACGITPASDLPLDHAMPGK